jgi:protein-disulfide isomerase
VSSPSFFGAQAGVRDRAGFAECSASTEPVPSIERDVQLAERLGGVGTPTLIMNGQFLRYVPDSAGLAAIFTQAQKGEL